MLDLCACYRGQTLALCVVDEVWNLAAHYALDLEYA